MTKSGLQRRLLESHLVIAFSGIVFVVVLCLCAAFLGRSANKLSNSVGPVPNAALSLINGLDSSVSSSQGWIYSNDTKFLEQNENAWLQINKAVDELQAAQQANQSIFGIEEFYKISNEIAELKELEARMIDQNRVGGDNQYRLLEIASPLADRITERLQTLKSSAVSEVQRYREEMRQITSFTLFVAFIGLSGLVLAAVIISHNNAGRMLRRLSYLADALEKFSKRGQTAALEVEGYDEISSLARNFNKMAKEIDEKQKMLRRHQNELEQRVKSRTRQLFKAKELAETTLRSIGDALISVDRTGTITLVNPAAEALLEMQAVEAFGMPLVNILVLYDQEDNTSTVLQPVEHCMQSNQVYSPDKTLYLHRTETERVPVKISAAPIAGDRGSVDGVIIILRDVTSELALQSELSHQANHDLLTGLANRTRFNNELKRLLSALREKPETHVLAFLDLDKFKTVNDTGGHAAGDELLRQLAHVLRDKLRPADLLARIGGDEFAVIFRDCKINHALKVCRKLRNRVSAFQFIWEEHTFRIGVSIGLVEINHETSVLSELLSMADEACYAAKKAGRNTIRVAQTQASEIKSDVDVSSHTTEIVKAIENGFAEFSLDENRRIGKDGENTFLEASLSGLKDHRGRTIDSNVIIPVAERYKLTGKLDLMLLDNLLSLLDRRAQLQEPEVPVAMSVSPFSLIDEEFIDDVDLRLYESTIPYDVVHFSISESGIRKNFSSIGTVLERWRSLGIKIILEGFSGNLSTFANLHNLPVDYLKIDDNYTRNIANNLAHQTVVRAITDLAHLCGKKTFAALESTGASFDTLSELNVDYLLISDRQNRFSAQEPAPQARPYLQVV